MNKRWIIKCAALCACAVLAGSTAFAQEWRLGDYVYVPAMQVAPVAGSITLRVEGLELSADSNEPVIKHALAGAEFGVYVFSGSGELTPWANPLYPSEPMRIRTGEGETRFSLPQGAEYFLRQESAPQGYSFDDEALIPVVDGEIVVQNAMAGQLVVRAVDSLGVPLSGVEMIIDGEDGSSHQLITNENGEAIIISDQAQGYSIREGVLPEGVFAARSVSGADALEHGMYAQVSPASRTRVTFEHPASGSVLLDMKLSVLDDHAQQQLYPLAGVRMDILADPAITLLTDEQGQARASLLEGTYQVLLSYEGDQGVILPLSEGQMIVSSGSTTVIELSAAEMTGRIVASAQVENVLESGSVMLVSEETGRKFGPYRMDAEGMAVSEPLEPGVYRIAEIDLAGSVQFGGVSCADIHAQNYADLALNVMPGQMTQADIHLLTREKQMFGLVAESIDENGELIQSVIGETLALTLVDMQGQEVARLDSMLGIATLEALSGEYTLHMEEKDAQRLGLQSASAVFELPSDEDTVRFAAENTRLILTAVNERGESVGGAAYQLTDSVGTRCEVVCDEDGIAVTPLLAPGEVMIETIDKPEGHASAQTISALARAGEAEKVKIIHESLGVAEIAVSVRSLDERGSAVFTPVHGAQVRLYRIQADGKQMTDTGIVLETDDMGQARISLEPGEYAAALEEQSLAQGWSALQPAEFSVRNTQKISAELVCLNALGGVQVSLTGGTLSDEELAQVRFEIEDADGSVTQLQAFDGVFYAGGLAAGEYVLRQTQIPQGYTLAAQRDVTLRGGEAAQIHVPLEEYAVLSVSKTGLTFDQKFNTYVVPLSGQYGVYIMQDGQMQPYPNAETQATLWANVTPQEIAMGKEGSVKLPAAVEGTTYYLHEMTSAPGFAADESYYEVRLVAGESTTLSCAVSSDRGFFVLDTQDVLTGMHIPGGEFELLDAKSGETVLTFEMGEQSYQNPMAVPVGTYRLRQRVAAPGYALSEPAEMDIVVEPYLSEGGTTTYALMTAGAVPQDGDMALMTSLYAAQQQGLSLLCVETGRTQQALAAPELIIEVGALGSERSDIASVVIAGAGDEAGRQYVARVEYCLDGGGWQPSDARMTGVLTGPTAVSLDDVRDDIRAVRLTYIDAETGEERVERGFTPGQVTLNVEASADGNVIMQAEAAFSGMYVYHTELGGNAHRLERIARAKIPFEMQAAGLFDTVSAGRDGCITGVAFFDEDADGVMDGSETGRYAGLSVSLQTASGEVLETVRTGSDGKYAFSAISGGEYVVQFDAGENVVFSSGDLFSEHMISRVKDMRYGTSEKLIVDGDHTDYVVNVGCIFASEIFGSVLESAEGGEQIGYTGMTIEMRMSGADENDEPLVVLTGGMGDFGFTRLLPGDYEISMEIPQGYLCRGAQEGRIIRTVSLASGESLSLGVLLIEKEAEIHGAVYVDEDGDGVIAPDAKTLEGVRVVLLAAEGAHTAQIAETMTDADGTYVFEHLYPGDYSVLFELEGEWAFTRYGADSDVYGAVSQSGTTRMFSLNPGRIELNVDAGATIPARLTVAVFEDTQYDGQKGVYEKMLSGAEVTLIRRENGQDAEEITYKTGDNGTVTFEGVSPGEYVIAYELPGLWRATKQVHSDSYPVSFVPQSTESSGRSEPFMLGMDQREAKLHIGAMLSGSITGFVYYDDDADAKRDDGEAACMDARAELLDSSAQVLAAAVPGDDGSYAFTGLAPGRYSVRFTAQEGCGFSGTERTAGRGGVLESDSNVSSTRSISVTGGQTTASIDAGVVRLSSVSGVLWEDCDADRLIGEIEQRMPGVSVHLMDGAGRNILRSTTADEQGRFTFDHLKPATYKIRVDAPAAYVFSGAVDGSSLMLETERDGRGYSVPFVLLGGVDVQDTGFGLLTQGTIGGFIWDDADFDGYMDGHEDGLRGVTVTLVNEAGDEVASRQTVRSGEFVFDQLMPGDYAVRVALPEGYVFTAEGAESIAYRDAGMDTPVGSLAMGGSIADVRIGALQQATVGGVVWFDQDDDGRRQNGDQGIAGVRAVLEVMTGADAGKTYETFTGENGEYHFDSVMPGEAAITFEIEEGYAFASQVSGTRRVSSVEKTDALHAQTDVFDVIAGENRNDLDVGLVTVGTIGGFVWEDAEYDGRIDVDEYGVSGAYVELLDAHSGMPVRTSESDESGTYEIDFVRKGEYRLRVTLPDGRIFTQEGESTIADVDSNSAQTAVFTIAMGESLEQVNIGAIRPAVMHGRVVIDENEDGLFADSESGLEGAAVTAMQGGTVVATAYADENGNFAFDTLRPGTYRLSYVLGDDTLFAQNAHLNMTDRDAMDAETREYAIEMGQQVGMDTVGIVRAARISGRAWMDENVSGSMDGGESVLSNVTAQLLGNDGSVIAENVTGGDGGYAFARLRSGSYVLRFKLPNGVLFTDYTGNPGDSCVPVMQGSEGTTNVFTLAMGEQLADMNVGGILPGRIGDTVWYDKDGNGLQDYKEPLIPDVSLTLLYVAADGTMTETATVSSDKYGYYAFDALRPGTYVLRLNAQEGDTLTSCFGAPLREIDNDINPDTGLSAPIELKSGQTLRNIDVGLTEHVY